VRIDFQARPGRIRSGLLASVAIGVFSLVFGGTAFADAAGDASPGGNSASLHPAAEVETVFVTARRRVESAQSVPISIDVLGQAQIEKSGQYTLQQLQVSVPTLFISSINARNTSINIRGLGSNVSVTNDGLENGVGFYVDQVYFGRVGLSQFDLIDLEQVEVLHGPQGTLFGKNTTAGAINITTRKPSFTPEAQFNASGGDFGFYQLQASVAGPLLGDKLAGRISVGRTRRGGFIDDVTTGQELSDYDNFTARGQLLADVSDGLEFRLIADYARQKRHCCGGVLDDIVTTYDNGTAIADNFYQKAARSGYTPAAIGAFKRISDANSPIQSNMEQWGLSLIGDWKLGPGMLTSVTAHREWNFNPKNDCDSTSLSNITLCQSTNHQKQWSQELRYASAIGSSIDYQVGLYYFWQIVYGYQITGYGADAALWNLGAATPLNQAALSGYSTLATSNPETNSYAAFGQANWHITPALTFTGGLRYTYEDKNGDFSNVVLTAADLSGFTPVQQATAAAIRTNFSRPQAYSGRLHSGAPSGLATLSYQLDADVLGYATYSHGEKSGGLNMTQLPVTLLSPNVSPESVDNYEIGLKNWIADWSLTLNVAAFWTEITDYQTQVYDLNPPYTASISNIPGVRSRGLEVSWDWAPIDGFALGGGAAYTEAVYLKYPNGPAPAELGPTSLYHFVDLTGKPLASAPKWVVSVSADYSRGLGLAGPDGLGPLEAYIHADTRYQSSNYTALSDSRYSLVKAYDIANLRLGVRTEEAHWDLSLFANNLLNQRYFISRSLATTGAISGTPGDPRTSGITLRIKY
jgi:iron complex outermembrane recepter protein